MREHDAGQLFCVADVSASSFHPVHSDDLSSLWNAKKNRLEWWYFLLVIAHHHQGYLKLLGSSAVMKPFTHEFLFTIWKKSVKIYVSACRRDKRVKHQWHIFPGHTSNLKFLINPSSRKAGPKHPLFRPNWPTPLSLSLHCPSACIFSAASGALTRPIDASRACYIASLTIN